MKSKKKHPVDAAELRRQAEQQLREQQGKPEPGQESAADNLRLLHELQVHQIELEMQNEQLEGARIELEAALEKYTDLYDFAPVGYLTLSQDGIIQDANLAAAKLLGTDRSALVKVCLEFFVSAADRPVFNAFIQQVFTNKIREACEVALQREGMPSIDVEMDAIVFESGQACRLALMDITERKQAERDRLILKKLESMGILAGGIAHDFNNLLTIIVLNLELAQTLPAGSELVHCLEEAKDAVFTGCSLTQELITFARGGDPIRQLTLLPGLIQESVRPALSGSQVRCDFSLAKDLRPAEVDKLQIAQVLRNLVLNAQEALPQGGVVAVRAENVVLRAQEQPSLNAGDYVKISIADQGFGIAKDVLPRIFDPYFSTKQRGDQKGMGLGLTICHAIIQKHQGAISVESELGEGTTCHILLPASNDSVVLEHERYGFKGVLKKPFLMHELEQVVFQLIGNKTENQGVS